ncbi:MAG: hypothetical protein U0359_37500 [Byssovorax sp.]
MKTALLGPLAGLFAASLLAVASPAEAAPGAEACNNIALTASAQCEVVVSGGCATQCTPPSFELACDGECDVSASASCTASCEADCATACQVDPGSFDCQADCQATCDGDCAGRCDSSLDKTHCETRCKATCSSDCSASCTGTAPSATCESKCQASCGGSCDVEANVDCYVSCESKLSGGCKTQCEAPEGALFCDGQYVDVGQSLDDCVAYLQASLNITVSGYAECKGNTCTAEASASCSCATVGASRPPYDLAGLAGAALGVGLLVSRRRRR